MPYKAVAVANFFLDLAEGAGKQLTPMQIQKLVFYAHGWNLAITSEPLIDEQVEAWKFGPVIRSLYSAFREYGSNPITEKYRPLKLLKIDGKTAFRWLAPPSIHDQPESAEFTAKLLTKIWDVFGGYSASRLSNMTHEPGTPWYTIAQKYDQGSIPKGTDIPSDVIREYFVRLGRRENVAG